MHPTCELLDHFEHCHREGIYARDWRKGKLTTHQLLMEGIREGLITSRSDYGQRAGERCFEIAANPGFESKQHDLHGEAVHLCSLSDIISSAIRRKEPWKEAPPVELGEGHIWESDCFLDPSGDSLRRVIAVSSWNDDRHFSTCRGWGTMGSMCAYGLPMKLCVVLLGQHRDGRYHSFWAKGSLHPVSKQLRFRKKTEGKFKESWSQIWREDRDEITTSDWLNAMLGDGVLQDSLILVDVPLPDPQVQKTIRELAIRKLEEIYSSKSLPDQQLSTCFWPTRCTYISPCHKDEPPSGRFGFVRINEIGT